MKKNTVLWAVAIGAFLGLVGSMAVYKVCCNEKVVAGYDKTVLTELLGKFDIPYNSLAQVVTDTQRVFLRQPGKERWETEKIHEEQKETLITAFDELGLVRTWEPSRTSYDYALFMGGTYPNMKNRLEYLGSLLEQGITFKKVVFLVGQRDLDYAKDLQNLDESGFDITQLKTETDLIEYIYNAFDQPALKTIPVELVDTPKQLTENGGLRRPNTADTICTWFEQNNPQSGYCLVISSQPFCNYQHITCKTLLPTTFVVETAGITDKASSSVSTYLDTIARTLYQYLNGKQVAQSSMPKIDRPVKFKF